MERNGPGSNSSGGGSGGRSRLHHKRRPGHRRNTQHNVATVEPICDLRKVINGVVSVDPDKLRKLVQRDPIEMHYAVEEEPFASGLFATVRKCRHRINGVEYAAKYASKIRYGQDCTSEILHEIALMSMCTTNPRIIHLIDVFDTPTHMILVMEYAPGGDLQTLMDDDMVPYEKDAVKFVRQVLEGLLFLHERNMAHLDIKLQNVLLMGTFPDCDVKLCDLEISRIIMAGQEVRELLGTPDYVSPEILHYEPITLAADIWSVGVMAYVLLTGFTPFGGDTDQETFHNICHGQLDFPDELFEDISPQAVDFIRKTLSRDPSARPTVRECLKHPWLTTWKNVASHQRETISSESQRKSSSTAHNGPDRTGSATCPRSAAAAASISTASSNNGHSAATARSLQRALSKSREVLYERVAASNLRKSTSKSRERLCEMRLSVSRSRDHLCDLLQPSTAQSRERLHSLRNFSKSHEVLSLLSGEQPPSVLPYERQASLFHIMPLAQSLDCFTHTSPHQNEQTMKSVDSNVVQDLDPSQTLPPILGGSLSSTFSDSTETLCNEKEKTGCHPDDATPSNSRPTTPTEDSSKTSEIGTYEEAKLVERGNPMESSQSPTRAEAVASSLKRLSRVGPPPLQITAYSEILTPPAIKSPWNWPSSIDPAFSISRSTPSPQVPHSPTPNPNPGYSIRKLMSSATKEKMTSPTSPSPSPVQTSNQLRQQSSDEWASSKAPLPQSALAPQQGQRSSESSIRQSFEASNPKPTYTEEKAPEAKPNQLSSCFAAPVEHQPETSRSRCTPFDLMPAPPEPSDFNARLTTLSPNTAEQTTEMPRSAKRSSALTPVEKPSSSTRSPRTPTNVSSKSQLQEQQLLETVRSKYSPPSTSAAPLVEQPTDAVIRPLKHSIMVPTLSNPTGHEQPKDASAEQRHSSRTDTIRMTIDTSLMSPNQQEMLPSILNRRRASWAYGSKQEDLPSASPLRQIVGKKVEPKLSVSELITSFSQNQGHGTVAMATATVATAGTGLIKPSSVKKLSVGTLFQHDASTTTAASSSKNLSEKEKTVFKPVAASIQVFQKASPAPLSTAITTTPMSSSTPRVTDMPSRSRSHHFSWDVRALPRLSEDVTSPLPEEPPAVCEPSVIPTEENVTGQSQVQTKRNDSGTKKVATEAPRTEPEADFGLRSGSVSSDTGCSSSSDLSDRSSEDVSERGTRRARAAGTESKAGTSERELMEEVVTEPPSGWTGRPRSFSVQADISFLAQPWNRVCTGSVARAFEKFGTKVESDNTNPSGSAPSTSGGASNVFSQRSRRQSTPGPFK